MLLGTHQIDDLSPAYIIAEMSANHGGDKNRAMEMIYAAKEMGADCVKIQTYTADTLTLNCDNEYFRITEGLWKGRTLYDLYKEAYMPWDWQPDLFSLAKKVGIDLISTPYDKSSVDFLETLQIPFYKIASFELVDLPFIEYVAGKNKAILLSTGMATKAEIQRAIEALKRQGNNQYVLLKCSSAYPAQYSDMNLRMIQEFKKEFDCMVGLSDHSTDALSAIVAISQGAKVIEKHFCLDRKVETPDVKFSMQPDEFSNMIHKIRQVEEVRGRVQYGPAEGEQENLKFRRSIFLTKDIKKGDTITEECIKSVRPSYGEDPALWYQVIGSIAKKDLKFGEPLNGEDYE